MRADISYFGSAGDLQHAVVNHLASKYANVLWRKLMARHDDKKTYASASPVLRLQLRVRSILIWIVGPLMILTGSVRLAIIWGWL